MSVLALLVYLVLIGVAIFLINTYIPMDGTIKKIITAVGVVIAILLCLYAFGLLGEINSVRVPRIQ